GPDVLAVGRRLLLQVEVPGGVRADLQDEADWGLPPEQVGARQRPPWPPAHHQNVWRRVTLRVAGLPVDADVAGDKAVRKESGEGIAHIAYRELVGRGLGHVVLLVHRVEFMF